MDTVNMPAQETKYNDTKNITGGGFLLSGHLAGARNVRLAALQRRG